MAHIVLVEDDVDIRSLIARHLAANGHDVESASSGLEGLELIVGSAPDLVILDLGLPDVEGSELLKMVRAVSNVPVIVATADGDSIVRLLDLGADDYVVKPYSTEQIEARIRAILRRVQSDALDVSSVLEIRGLRIDIAAQEVELDGKSIELGPKLFAMLTFLAQRCGEVVSKRELLAEVWREPYGGSERTIDVHLSTLRKQLGESAAEPRYLHTVHGVGVKLMRPSG